MQSKGPAAAAARGLLLDPPDVTRILTLKQQHGWGTKRIADELGISRRTVRRYLKLGGYKPYVRRKTPRALDEYIPWLRERFAAVRGNAEVLLRELHQRGEARLLDAGAGGEAVARGAAGAGAGGGAFRDAATLSIKGESFRLREKRKAGLIKTTEAQAQ